MLPVAYAHTLPVYIFISSVCFLLLSLFAIVVVTFFYLMVRNGILLWLQYVFLLLLRYRPFVYLLTIQISCSENSLYPLLIFQKGCLFLNDLLEFFMDLSILYFIGYISLCRLVFGI